MMIAAGGGIPMYKMKAKRGPLWVSVLVFIVGGLLTAYFYGEDSYSLNCSRWLLTLIITGILFLMLAISATSHFWFRHLWHHRPGYKRG